MSIDELLRQAKEAGALTIHPDHTDEQGALLAKLYNFKVDEKAFDAAFDKAPMEYIRNKRSARKLIETYEAAKAPESWEDDENNAPYAAEIKAAHPTYTKDWNTYSEAMELIHYRRSKFALVHLVNWLLVKSKVPAKEQPVGSTGLDTLVLACDEVLRLMGRWEKHYAYSSACQRACEALRTQIREHLAKPKRESRVDLEHIFEIEQGANIYRPRILDLCYTAFLSAKQPNSEDGGASDWMNDTMPKIKALIEQMKERVIQRRP